jgi:SAM-dependent methyltransferase
MNALEREQICQQMAQDKRRLGLPLEDVRRIDRYFADNCGITMPRPPARWKRRLRELGGKGLADEYWELHDAIASHRETGLELPEGLETVFYDLLADPRICGHVHSQKRTEILDAACLLIHLARILKITGPILDVGCHTGHHAHLLAQEVQVPVTGIDLSAKAIEIARARTAGTSGLNFNTFSLSDPSFTNVFEMIYAVRSIDYDDASIASVAAALQPGGLAVIVTSGAPDASQESRDAIRAEGLGWGLSDVVGGWVGEERHYEANAVLLLIKDGTREIPADFIDQATSTWTEHFQDYANNPETPWPEKTQAYFRGHWINSNAF